MQLVKILEGNSPIILTQPHGGTYIPTNILHQYNDIGLSMSDTDWHINRLYDGLLERVSTVQALFSRYIIDPNRNPSGEFLYPGQNTTELCPTIDFSGQPIYRDGMQPDAEEVAKRLKKFHSVYHFAISEQIQRISQKYGFALLFDCHSIKSNLPYLFAGELPDINLGTNDGRTCDPKIEKVAVEFHSKISGYKFVLNGRFKGGWTTRHYGDPKNGIHTMQLELAKKTYMEEFSPWNYDHIRAKKIRNHLKKLLNFLETELKNISIKSHPNNQSL